MSPTLPMTSSRESSRTCLPAASLFRSTKLWPTLNAMSALTSLNQTHKSASSCSKPVMWSFASDVVGTSSTLRRSLLSSTSSPCCSCVRSILVSKTLFDWSRTLSRTTSSGSQHTWPSKPRSASRSTHFACTARHRRTSAGRRPSSRRRTPELLHHPLRGTPEKEEGRQTTAVP